jgi:NitT/TauT family transport system substrate-binding protein
MTGGSAKRGLGIPTLARLVVVATAALIWIAMWRFSIAGDDSAAAIHVEGAEAPDEHSPSTATEWTFVAEPPVQRIKQTPEEMQPDYTIKIAIDRWPGWAPLIYANGGYKAGKAWTTFAVRKREFRVELVVYDSPAQLRDAYKAGAVHIGSGTIDMLPFLLDELAKTPATMPRVMQQVDWSHGADGIVARSNIATVQDLQDQSIVVVEHSPAHFFVLATLFEARLQAKVRFAKSAAEAMQLFERDTSIAACALRAPDVYALGRRDGNKILVTTKTASYLIADVWYARADVAAKFPGLLKSIGRGVFDAMRELEDPVARKKVATLIAERTGSSADDVLRTFDDVQWTNYAANRAFLLDANNPINFPRTYEVTAAVSSRNEGKVPFEQLVDFMVLKSLAGFPEYTEEKYKYPVNYQPWSITSTQTKAGAVLAKKLTVYFAPSSSDPFFKTQRGPYDPDAEASLKEISKLATEYGASARITIEGHSDSSYRAWVDEQRQIKLSSDRANAIKQALLTHVPSLAASQITTHALGATRPASAGNPGDHARNRRVEITLYRADERGPLPSLSP